MANKLYDVIRKDHQAKGEHDLDDNPAVDYGDSEYKPPKLPRADEDHPHLRKIVVVGGAAFFIALLYIIGVTFVHADVTVTERQIPFSLFNTQIELDNEKTAGPDRLAFQAMAVTDSVTRQVFGSAVTTSTTDATGQAVIFNQYSTRTQIVRKGTTLTGANGEKYLTTATISVPGYTGSGSQKSAGSATVGIVAAAVGPAYNTPGTTFTISGWGGANAKTFYASSVGAISGGQNGAMHTLDTADQQQTIATLQAALTEELSRETNAQIPSNFITFPSLQFTSIDNSATVLSGETIQFPATMKGTMVSYLIPRDGFETAIAAKAISDHTYPDVNIPDLGGITVDPVSVLPADPNNIPDTITLNVSGQGTIITEIPPDTITQDVLGINRSDFTAALSGIAEIDTAQYTLIPFWAPYFPSRSGRITIEIK
jgi:hypothetical protein